MLVLTVVGARPQFVKAAVLSEALRGRCREVLVHTGQHYDEGLSEQFFRELEIPKPDHMLEVGSGSHASQTGQMLVRLEAVMIEERPDVVVLYGDTNSTLAGALAAAKIGVPIAHVEAGCRSYDRAMPEEVNRVVTDHVSTLLFCPTRRSVENLEREGVTSGVHDVGDLMFDLQRRQTTGAGRSSTGLEALGLSPGGYLVLTIHRPSNTDRVDRLEGILRALHAQDVPVVFPVHPRTRGLIPPDLLGGGSVIRFIDPVGYRDMAALVGHARMVLTDSGGVQKEAFFHGTPCVTLRDTTEWMETVDAGWNRLVGTDYEAMTEAIRSWRPAGPRPGGLFGDGHAAARMADILLRAS